LSNLQDFIDKVNRHLRVLKPTKIIVHTDSEVYQAGKIRVFYSDFKGIPKAVISLV